MVDQLTNALTISCIALGVMIVWAVSIALVLRDVNRRDLPRYEQAAWVLLAALIPMVGGIAYLFTRLLDRFLSPGTRKLSESEKRVTAMKEPDRPVKRLPTVAAVDTYRETIADIKASGKRPQLYLEVLSGPNSGQRYPIDTLPVRIGRGTQASLSLDADQGISRQHAEIHERGGHFRIRDLDSKHGTYLNGKLITDERLNPGDQIKVGQSKLVLTVEGQDASA